LDKIEGDIQFTGDEFTTLETLSASNNTLPLRIYFDGTLKIDALLDLRGLYAQRSKLCKLKVFNQTPFDKILDGISDNYDLMDGETERRRINFWAETTRYIFNCFHLTDTIEKIVTDLDSSVKFDSFSFIALYNLNVDWSNIHFATTKNTAEHTTHSFETETDISLEKILKVLAELFHIYWKLELVGSDYYFRLYHIQSVVRALGTDPQYDLTTWKGKDWTYDKEYEYKTDNRYRKIVRTFPKANYNDFVGRDILIPSMSTIDDIKEIGVSDWLFDVAGLIADADNYPKSSSQYFMLAADSAPVLDDTRTLDSWVVAYQPTGVGAVTLTWEPSPGRLKIDVSTTVTSFIISTTYSEYKGLLYRLRAQLDYSGTDISRISVYIPNMISKYDVNEYWNSWQLYQGGTGYINTIPLTLDTIEHTEDLGYLTADSGTAYILIECNAFTTFYLNTLELTSYYLELLKATGILTPTDDLLNMPLSLSKIDDIAGKWELPATPATINGVSTAVNVKKNKKLKEITVPMSDFTLLDFNSLIKTGLGNAELTEFAVSLKNDFAKINSII
jgi:hypothetical protein